MRLTSLAASVVLFCGLCLAAEPQDKDFVSLFDGKTFNGWKIIGCEAEVQDGNMFLKAGNGVVRTERAYRDYVLEFECKALKADNWDSGVYFRCKDPAPGRPWPAVWQVNMRKGMEGNVQEVKGAQSKGLTEDGDWNHFRLTAIGTRIELSINGKPAWKADGVTDPEGFIAIQAEIPGGGQYLFRNIRIAEIK